MAHAPNVAQCMLRSGALHYCDKNKLILQYSILVLCFSYLAHIHFKERCLLHINLLSLITMLN